MKTVFRASAIVSTLGLMFLLSACGKNETLDKQASQRDAVGPKLKGTWVTQCESGRINRLTFDADKLTVERVTHFDPECGEKERTVRQTGKYSLAHNFKEGILNSIIFQTDNDLKITFHTDFDVDNHNNTLTKLNNEKETEIRNDLAPAEKKRVTRENLKLRAAKEMKPWKRDEEKTLTKLQAEKLDLNAAPATEIGNRVSLRYEIDNGYLQFGNGGDFGHVYSQPQQ